MSFKVSFLYKNMYDDVCKGSRQERERKNDAAQTTRKTAIKILS